LRLLCGGGNSGCDVFLMEMPQFPAVRMLFGVCRCIRAACFRTGLQWLEKTGGGFAGRYDEDGALVVLIPTESLSLFDRTGTQSDEAAWTPAIVRKSQKAQRNVFWRLGHPRPSIKIQKHGMELISLF